MQVAHKMLLMPAQLLTHGSQGFLTLKLFSVMSIDHILYFLVNMFITCSCDEYEVYSWLQELNLSYFFAFKMQSSIL